MSFEDRIKAELLPEGMTEDELKTFHYVMEPLAENLKEFVYCEMKEFCDFHAKNPDIKKRDPVARKLNLKQRFWLDTYSYFNVRKMSRADFLIESLSDKLEFFRNKAQCTTLFIPKDRKETITCYNIPCPKVNIIHIN